MAFEDLIGLIVFLLIVFGSGLKNLLQRLGGKRPGGGEGESSTTDELARRLREEALKRARERREREQRPRPTLNESASRREATPPPPPPRERPDVVVMPQMDAPEPVPPVASPPPEPVRPKPRPEPSIWDRPPGEKQPRRPVRPTPVMMGNAEKKTGRRGASTTESSWRGSMERLSVERLRDVVLLTEVWQPPLSLRREQPWERY